jgi:hypothetical protein
MEGDHVTAEQATQQFPSPRQSREEFRRGKRDVEKEPDSAVGAVAQHPRHEHQVVVVDPEDRVHHASGRGRGLAGHGPVGALVCLPPLAVEDRSPDEVVEQGPERGVGEPIAIVAYVGAAEGTPASSASASGRIAGSCFAPPSHPTQVVGRRDTTGRRAVTSPPGDRVQRFPERWTGNRFDTTTRPRP